MKSLLIIAAVALSSTAASAQYGYSNSYGSLRQGTGSNSNNHYVAPHYNQG
jgi:hypothetical protein